jgi:hypothetical protein
MGPSRFDFWKNQKAKISCYCPFKPIKSLTCMISLHMIRKACDVIHVTPSGPTPIVSDWQYRNFQLFKGIVSGDFSHVEGYEKRTGDFTVQKPHAPSTFENYVGPLLEIG